MTHCCGPQHQGSGLAAAHKTISQRCFSQPVPHTLSLTPGLNFSCYYRSKVNQTYDDSDVCQNRVQSHPLALPLHPLWINVSPNMRRRLEELDRLVELLLPPSNDAASDTRPTDHPLTPPHRAVSAALDTANTTTAASSLAPSTTAGTF